LEIMAAISVDREVGGSDRACELGSDWPVLCSVQITETITYGRTMGAGQLP